MGSCTGTAPCRRVLTGHRGLTPSGSTGVVRRHGIDRMPPPVGAVMATPPKSDASAARRGGGGGVARAVRQPPLSVPHPDRDAKSTSGMPVPCSSSTPATATPTGRIGLSTRLLPYCHFPSPGQTGPTASDGRTGSVDSSTSISRWHEVSRVSGTHRVDEVEAGYCSA